MTHCLWTVVLPPVTYKPEFCPPVSVVVPAYNEALVIERTVSSLAASDYPQFEVLVVDDGSTDGTSEIVEDLDLENVRVISQPNNGKAAALNSGVSQARYPIVAMVDADTAFETQSLRVLTQPFADPRVGAVSGNTKVGNRRGLWGRFQHIEYVIGFNLDRRLYDTLQCIPTVPGAIGAFRREAVIEVGGVSAVTLAEDTDLTLAVARQGWRITYTESARGWTEAPTSLGALWRQRYRWSYGTMQALYKHRAAIWRRNEGRVGRRAIPYMVVFQILLPLGSPLIDLLAIYGLAFLNPYLILAYYTAFNVLALGQAIYAFRLDRESLRPLWLLPVQQLVYRQLSYLLLAESLRSALLGLRLRWQTSDRTGQLDSAPKAPSMH
jgi:cellulose synthase/poly-beta-1,6-N-acetylglucosamine synthase-like glycosyltransferase